MTAREVLNRLNDQATSLAKRRGEFDNARQTAINERKSISPWLGEDGVWVDPSDDNPALRPRRAELLKVIEALSVQIAEVDDLRREIEPGLAEARITVQLADAASIKERGEAALVRIVGLVIELLEALRVYATIFAKADALYPDSNAGQLAVGRQIAARCGLPLLTRLCERVDGGLTALLEAIAEHEPSLLPTAHQTRIRAERIVTETTKAANFKPQPIVVDDLPQKFEAKISSAPDHQEVEERFRKRREEKQREEAEAAAKK